MLKKKKKKSEVSILKAYPKAFLQVTFILNHKKIKDTFCWTQTCHSCWDCSGKEVLTPLLSEVKVFQAGNWFDDNIDLPVKLVVALGFRDWLSFWLLTFVCVSGESYESWLAFLAWLSLKEPLDYWKKKMDFANSCLRHPHRRKASRFRNGNSRQTTEAKDTSVCKCFQMQTNFSFHSLQFSF